MRSRRHKLQVSTFPFLAVLLCAMGALLLVLLVMDRRAHDAARARAEQAARQTVNETAREAEERRAALEQARQAALAAQQQEQQGQHAGLERQMTEARGEAQSVDDQIVQAAGRLRSEQDEEAALRRKTEAEQAKATAEEQALVQVRGDEAKKADQSEASRQALAEMTADLAQLERTLADLKAARGKGQKTYSVVPYKGKRGEDRRPLYVECGSGEVIFHPDRTALSDSRLVSELRREVERRLARQKEQLAPAQAAGFSPYLMLLVRPDGVVTYYMLRDALRALKIDFGYEFIDQDWALDFPDDGSPSQPWTTAAKPPAPPPAPAPAASPLHGVAPGLAPSDGPSVVTGSANSDKIGSGDSVLGPVIAGPPRIASGAPPLGSPGEPGNSSAPAMSEHSSQVPGDAVALGPRGSEVPPRIGSAPSDMAPGAPSSASPVPAQHPGTPGSASAPPSAHSPGAPNSVPPPPPSWAPTEPPSASPAVKDAANPTHGSKPGATAGDDPDDDPFLKTPPPPLPITSRPAPSLRPARLTGDRDWIIYVECKPEGVVIYPTQLLVPVSALDRPAGGNPLPQALQQLIDRKQATVKPGDPPYRPEVRFLVHPDAGRTYHLAYPTVNGLAAPKTAQTLGPDDDVATIVAGH